MKKIAKALFLTVVAGFVCATAASCGEKAQTDQEEKKEEKPAPEPVKPTKQESVLSVMSFNVAVDNQQEGKGWQWRKPVVLNMLEKEQPEVIGFQEAQAHEITDMVDGILDKKGQQVYNWYGLGRDTGRVPAHTTSYSSEESMAIFWMKDSLDVTDYGTFWLSQTPSIPGKGWDASYNRTCTWVKFVHKRTGQKFMMFNTHLDNNGKTARSESMKLIANQIFKLNTERVPVLLSADFNTVSTDAIFAPIDGTMKSTRDYALRSEKDKNTYNGYKSPRSQIDHIFFQGSGFAPLTFRVLDGSYGDTWISDHYPILATYRYTTTQTQ